jgi:hypothetical protein
MNIIMYFFILTLGEQFHKMELILNFQIERHPGVFINKSLYKESFKK